MLGRHDEGTRLVRKALDVDPLSAYAWTMYGALSWRRQEIADARAAFDRALEISPDSTFAHFLCGMMELDQRRNEAAAGHFRRTGECFRQAGTAMIEHTLGHAEASQRALDELKTKYSHGFAYQIAQVHAWRGENAAALDWLEVAWEQRDAGVARFRFEPWFVPLRNEPRFRALVRRLDLPE